MEGVTGTFLDTCRDCLTMRLAWGKYLRCYCENQQGEVKVALVEMSKCTKFGNANGRLVCQVRT